MPQISRVEVFRGKGLVKNWYWRTRAKNGEITSTSEGYFSKYNASRAARRMFGPGIEIRYPYGP